MRSFYSAIIDEVFVRRFMLAPSHLPLCYTQHLSQMICVYIRFAFLVPRTQNCHLPFLCAVQLQCLPASLLTPNVFMYTFGVPTITQEK
jgi:hypothetical protein